MLSENCFAGTSAGLIYEGERKIWPSCKVGKELPNRYTDVQNLYRQYTTGKSNSVSQVANISIWTGTCKIHVTMRKRRIIVGLTCVTGCYRVLSEDIKQIMNSKVDMPAGIT